MLRDMTIGQFYPVESPIHRLDSRVKVVGVFLYLISLFIFQKFCGYAVVTLFLATIIFLSKVPLKYVLRGMKPILFLLVFTALFNLFGTHGDIAFQWKFISITWQGIQKTLFMSMRLIYLVIGSSMLTYTTTPNQLVHEFAMMMSLALRFIPILLEEANRIINAQSARGADFEEGKIWQRMRAMISILVPLLVSALRRAYELANAMEARCYRGGEGRTKMKPLRYRAVDISAYGILVLYLLAIIAVNHFVPI